MQEQSCELTTAAIEGAGEVASLPVAGLAEQVIRAVRRIVIPRAALALALPPPQLALSPVRGAGADGFVIYEDGGGMPDAHLTVLVHEGGNGTWQLIVTTNPPVTGRLQLASGTTKLIAVFEAGRATIANIPFALLSDGAEPDLELIIVPVSGNPSNRV